MKNIIRAKTNPPKNTRAKVRSDFIHFLKETGLKGEVNWDSLAIINGTKLIFDILSPFKTYNHKFDEFVKSREK